MNNDPDKSGPYHGAGEPGCAVGELSIALKVQDGSTTSAYLLDAGAAATELELLRTVASGMGIRWGRDDLGWWAVVPRKTSLKRAGNDDPL